MLKQPSFESLVSGLSLGLCIVDDDQRVVYVNQSFAEMVGSSPEALAGKPVTELLKFSQGGSVPTAGTHGAWARGGDGGTLMVATVAQPCAEGTCLLTVPPSMLDSVRWATTQDHLSRVEQLLDRVERIHNAPTGAPTDRDLSTSPMLAQLSRREREIVTALVSAKPVKQIAASLNISPHTVRNHLKSSFRKLNVGSQVELVAKLTMGPSLVSNGTDG